VPISFKNSRIPSQRRKQIFYNSPQRPRNDSKNKVPKKLPLTKYDDTKTTTNPDVLRSFNVNRVCAKKLNNQIRNVTEWLSLADNTYQKLKTVDVDYFEKLSSFSPNKIDCFEDRLKKFLLREMRTKGNEQGQNCEEINQPLFRNLIASSYLFGTLMEKAEIYSSKHILLLFFGEYVAAISEKEFEFKDDQKCGFFKKILYGWMLACARPCCPSLQKI
jgi:hypothetical protein